MPGSFLPAIKIESPSKAKPEKLRVVKMAEPDPVTKCRLSCF